MYIKCGHESLYGEYILGSLKCVCKIYRSFLACHIISTRAQKDSRREKGRILTIMFPPLGFGERLAWNDSFQNLGGTVFVSVYEGCCYFGYILGAPDFENPHIDFRLSEKGRSRVDEVRNRKNYRHSL